MQETIKRFFALIVFSLLTFLTVAQAQKQVKGTVKDSSGEPLVGVTVSVKGTTKATLTDIDGKYVLSVPNDAKSLTATYVGMKTAEKSISGSVINFNMEDNSSQLNEVVVVGYGTVKRKDLTGSVASVKSDAIQQAPVTNVAEAITGKLAGVQITTTEGSPDAEMKIRVRGGGSITQSNDPLYIVDGFPVSSISDIPASDIESIDVLKDASSTAIYGSRGANGVILITTKTGQAGKLSVSYNTFYSWKKNEKELGVLSPSDYVHWQYELANLRGSLSNYTKYFGNYQDIDMYDDVPSNDWQNLVFGRTGHTFNQSISLNGGSDNIKYSFNYTHVNDKAIMIGSSFKRDNFSLKLNTKPSKTTAINFSVRYSDTDIRGGGTNDASSTSSTDKRLKYSLLYPTIPMADISSSGDDEDDDFGSLYNPVENVSENDRMQTRNTTNMVGSFQWEPISNLKLKTEFGLDDNRSEDDRYYGSTTYLVQNNYGGDPAVSLENIYTKTFRSTNTINYDFKKLFKNKDHSLTGLIGHEYIITQKNDKTDIVAYFPTTFTAEDAWKFTTEGTAQSTDNYYYPDDKLLSWFSRFNYDYKSKYLVSATFRADGSSKFGDNHKWGYFPSVAGAWRVSSENFMEKTKGWLDDLKLRLSYGTAGNNNIPSGQVNQTFSSTSTTWVDDYSNYWGPSKYMSNPDLKWETTITRNVGVDFSIIGSKLTGSLDAYLNTTKDLLILFPVSGTGYDYQYRNMGQTQNKGFEATVNWVALDTKKAGLTFSANISFNKNKIKSLGMMSDYLGYTNWASSEIGGDYTVAVGQSIGKMYGYKSDGRYEVSDFQGYDSSSKTWTLNDGVADASSIVGTIRPGSMKLKDLNGDGSVTTDDRTIIGDANPIHTGGFTINGRLSGFDLTAAFNWSYGNDIYNANKIEGTMSGKYNYRNMLSDMATGKRWTNIGADGTITNDAVELATLNAHTTMWSPYTSNMIFSDWAVEDGSFLRLGTLTLGYTLPSALTNKMQVKSARFYLTGYNVFCLTKYSGMDPEVSTIRGTNLTPGVDYSAYPKSRQFVIGMNLNF